MDAHALASAVRDACVKTAKEAYAEAGLHGLCDEGRFEAAVGAIQMLDLAPLLRIAETGSRMPDDR